MSHMMIHTTTDDDDDDDADDAPISNSTVDHAHHKHIFTQNTHIKLFPLLQSLYRLLSLDFLIPFVIPAPHYTS